MTWEIPTLSLVAENGFEDGGSGSLLARSLGRDARAKSMAEQVLPVDLQNAQSDFDVPVHLELRYENPACCSGGGTCTRERTGLAPLSIIPESAPATVDRPAHPYRAAAPPVAKELPFGALRALIVRSVRRRALGLAMLAIASLLVGGALVWTPPSRAVETLVVFPICGVALMAIGAVFLLATAVMALRAGSAAHD